MGRYFALSLNLDAQAQPKPKNKKAASMKTNYGFWVMAFLIIFGMVYLTQVNSTSTKGYEIKKLESRLTELKEQQKRLDLEAAALKSVQNLEAEVKVLNLIPSQGIRYLPKESDYAYKK